ncbi:MAG: Mpo1-like protein [Salinisphaeraceae bacterium]|nr:Mpo1-like protein [Salinisphaeraceae bacterium]
MQQLDALLLEYAGSHRNPVNQVIHWICIPLITFTVVAFGWLIPSAWMSGWLPADIAPFFNFATLGGALALVYYWRLAPWLFAIMLAFLVGSVALAWSIEQSGLPLGWIAAGIFVVTWIAQFYGHHVEGAKPSFFKDVQFLLVGPAFIADKARRGKFID